MLRDGQRTTSDVISVATRITACSLRRPNPPQRPAFLTMSRRTLKAAEAIREVVSMAILTEVKDPRVSDVTVTRVEVSGDMREAKVYITVMGSETKQQLCMRGLKNSTGFLQKRISERIDTRYIPRIEFRVDKGQANAQEVNRIFAKIADERATEAPLEDDAVTDETDSDNREF